MIATSPDGQWAAVRRGREVSLLAGGAGPPTSSIEIDTDDADMVIVGPPSVLAVVMRGTAAGGHRMVLYLPPYLDAVAQLELEGPMRIATVTGPRVVLLSPDGKAVTVVRIAGRALSAQSIDTGSPVEFAVGLERNQVLFALLRKLEAWDAVSGRPLLRMQLPLPPPPRLVGPAHGHVWALRRGSDDIVVCRLSDGRPFQHQLGASIRDVVYHPASPVLILVTARGLVRLHCFAHALTLIDAPWQPGAALAQLVVGDDIALLGMAEHDEEPWRVQIAGAGAPAITLDGPDTHGEPLVGSLDRPRAVRQRMFELHDPGLPRAKDRDDFAARFPPPAPEPLDGGRGDAERAETGRAETGRVEVGRADSGRAETGRADTGHADGGHTDGGHADGGRADTGHADTGHTDSGGTDMGSADPGRPDMGRADPGRPDMGRADPGRPDMGRADPGRPEIARLDIGRSDVARSDVARLDIGRTGVPRPGAGGLDIARIDVPRPDVARLDIGGSGVARTDVARLDIARSDVPRPDVARLDIGGSAPPRSDVPRPDAGRPDGGRSDASRSDAGRFESWRGDGARPDGGRSDAGRFEAGRIESGRGDGARSDGRPDSWRADAARPQGWHSDAGRPDVVRPDVVRPDVVRLDIGRADGGRSSAEQFEVAGARGGVPGEWREGLAALGTELVRGAQVEMPEVGGETEIGRLAERLALGTAARHALGVLYGAYLVGEPAVAIARLAQALGEWSEALGQGELGTLAMLWRRGGKAALRGAVTDVLDGAAPRAIRIVGTGEMGPRAGVARLAREGKADAAIEQELAGQLGRIGVIEGGAAVAVLEARLHGATAVALVAPATRPVPWPRDAGLIVVADGDAPAWVAGLPSFTGA
jgi:hypothetical protein